MILKRKVDTAGEVHFVSVSGTLINLHDINIDCIIHGCCVHNPDENAYENIEKWPYNWRDDIRIMERMCRHGVGHPDPDDAAYHNRVGQDYQTRHGCDGCCSSY